MKIVSQENSSNFESPFQSFFPSRLDCPKKDKEVLPATKFGCHHISKFSRKRISTAPLQIQATWKMWLSYHCVSLGQDKFKKTATYDSPKLLVLRKNLYKYMMLSMKGQAKNSSTTNGLVSCRKLENNHIWEEDKFWKEMTVQLTMLFSRLLDYELMNN